MGGAYITPNASIDVFHSWPIQAETKFWHHCRCQSPKNTRASKLLHIGPKLHHDPTFGSSNGLATFRRQALYGGYCINQWWRLVYTGTYAPLGLTLSVNGGVRCWCEVVREVLINEGSVYDFFLTTWMQVRVRLWPLAGAACAIGASPLPIKRFTWWRHHMESFSASLALCAGSSPVTGEFPSQGPATRSFDVLFGLRVNKRLNKQSWSWWLVTPLRSLRRHCNELWTALPAYAPRWRLIAPSCVHPFSTCPFSLCINSEKLRIPPYNMDTTNVLSILFSECFFSIVLHAWHVLCCFVRTVLLVLYSFHTRI